MAKQTGLACALYTGGYDVGGDTQSFVIHGGPAAIDTTDITQSAFDRLGGLRTAEMNWVSYFDTAAGASHAALSPLPTADVISTALISPIAIGCPAVSQVSKQLSYDGTRANAGEFTFAVPEQSDGYGQEWGVALTAGEAHRHRATNGTSYDFGAASASLGAQAYLQVFSFSGTDVTVGIEDSANNCQLFRRDRRRVHPDHNGAGGAADRYREQPADPPLCAGGHVHQHQLLVAGFRRDDLRQHGGGDVLMQPFRIEPQMPAAAYRTYQIVSPPDRQVRAACEQVGCLAWQHGWETQVDERTDLGLAQATYIRQKAGRTFTEQRTGEGLTVFRFEAFQRCFAEHQTRPERYFNRGGDWRGNPRGDVREHVRPGDWVEDFGEHQQALADRLERG